MVYGYNDKKEKVDVDELISEVTPPTPAIDLDKVHAVGSTYVAENGEDPNKLFGGHWIVDDYLTYWEHHDGHTLWVKTSGPEAYAVYDWYEKTLTFFRDTQNKYTDGQTSGSKTYFTGIEDPRNTPPSWQQSYGIAQNCKYVVFKDHIAPTSTSEWFKNFSNLIELLNLSRLHTRKIIDMSCMFQGCEQITQSMFDILFYMYSVSDTSYMFDGCENISAFPNFVWRDGESGESTITDMTGMFRGCADVEQLDLNLNSCKFPHLTSTAEMFKDCYQLSSLGSIDSFDVSNVQNMEGMFEGCNYIQRLYLTWWETGNVINTSNMFKDCSNLRAIYIYIANIITVTPRSTWDMSSVTSSTDMFTGCTLLVGGNGTAYSSSYTDKTYARLDITGDPGYLTGYVAYARYDSSNNRLIFFRDDYGKYTEGQTSGNYTYYTGVEDGGETHGWLTYASQIKSVYFNDEVRPIQTRRWFLNCYNLTTISNNINPEYVVSMEGMFEGCSKLFYVDMYFYGTPKLKYTQNMFNGCSSLRVIGGIQTWDTSSLEECYNMFENTALEYIDLSSWDTSNLEDCEEMFKDSVLLKTIFVSDKWDISSLQQYTSDMFDGCESLIGGVGTEYDSTAAKDKTRAVIDYGSTRPGYLTYYPDLPTEAYAVYDPNNYTLTFFRDIPGRYTDLQISGSKTYFSGIESYLYSQSWKGVINTDVRTVIFKHSIHPISTYQWFYQMTNLTEILGIEKLDTSYTRNMYCMFYNCNKLTSLDVSHFDTSNVTNMQYMFFDCQLLEQLDLTNFNTEKVTTMYSMFNGCDSLTELDLSSFDTTSVTDMYGMFYSCDNLETIYVSDTWDVSNVTQSTSMFKNSTKLVGGNGTVYDSSHVDKTYAVIDTDSTPGYFTEGTQPIVPEYPVGTILHFNTEQDMSRYEGTWLDITKARDDDYTYVRVGGEEAYAVYRSLTGTNEEATLTFFRDEPNKYSNRDTEIDGNYTLTYYTGVETQTSDRPAWASRNSANMNDYITDVYFKDYIQPISTRAWFQSSASSFSGGIPQDVSSNLTDIHGLRLLSTTKVTSMQDMFMSCNNLINGLDFSNFDTSNVEYMSGMFEYCNSIQTLDLSSFDITGVNSLQSMFQGCRNMNILNVSSFITTNITNMRNMFSVCKGLTTIDISNFDTSNVTDMRDMFSSCQALTTIKISASWSTNSVTNSSNMFYRCTSLPNYNSSNIDASAAKSTTQGGYMTLIT